MKMISKSSYDIMFGSKVTCTTSAWPVSPEQTSRYVGFPGAVPPVYPETTFSTPFISFNTASMHQKHPPPTVANSILVSVIFKLLFLFFVIPSILNLCNTVNRLAPDRLEKRGLNGHHKHCTLPLP